jgi:flagellar hook protein FlgE
MSLYGIMRTGVSGMNAQANRLSTVAENVANVNTTGYKSASCEFSSLLLAACPGDYESGSVLTNIRNHVSEQGSLTNTSSLTDLAISGDGFFVVSDEAGTPYLTRAGSFVPNGSGQLVNAAGFQLMGYRLDPDQPDVTVNGFTNLTPINLEDLALSASATTTGSFVANLPADDAAVAAADLPSLNIAGAQFTAKSSLITYDNLGGEVRLDLYFSKTSDEEWELAVFDASLAAPGGGFPYASGPLTVETVLFDGTTGAVLTGQPTSIDIPIPDGQTLALDIEGLSQLSTNYVVISASANGNPPSGANVVEISGDGFVYASYDNGTRVPVYRIPLAHVASPDMLTPLAGNVFSTTSDSGDVIIGFAQTGGLGDIISNALEQSTVDLASELTSMIDAQRSYTANSKVFQTGSELMEVLVNLKR